MQHVGLEFRHATTLITVNGAIDHLGTNPDGILGAAGLLVDPSLPDGQAAKSCIIAMVVMHPTVDGPSVKQQR